MSDLTFDAYDKDGAPRVYVGMFRPPIEECRDMFMERKRQWGQFSWRLGEDTEWWLRGEFDKPLYRAAEGGAP